MKDFMKQYGIVMMSTTELIVTIVAFIWVGKFIDQKFGLQQKGLIVSTLVGTLLAFIRFIMQLQKMNKDEAGK